MKYVILEYGVAEGTSDPTGEVVDSAIEIKSSKHMTKINKVLERYLDTPVEIISLPYKHAERWLAANWQDVFVLSASVGDFMNSGFLRQYKDKFYMCCSSGNEGANGVGGLSKKGYFQSIGAVKSNMRLADYSSWEADYVDYVGIADEWYEGSQLRGTSFACPQHGAEVMDMQVDFFMREGRRMTVKEILANLKHYAIDLGLKGKDSQHGYGYFEYKGEYLMENNISDWAVDAQKWVMENGFSDGTRPKDTVTREELWTIMHRMFMSGK